MNLNPFAIWIAKGIENEGRTIGYYAELFRVSENTIYQWRSGRQRPGIAKAVAIERVSDGAVPVTSWLEAAEG